MDIKRLEQFMLVMLSSDQPGEVAAASAMLKRELKKGGKDIHWLKDNLLKGGNGAGSSNDYHELLKARNQVRNVEQRLAEMRRERDKAVGERNMLQYELDTIKRAAAGQTRARKDEFKRMRSNTRGFNGSWSPGDPPPDIVDRIHIASWCLRYLATHPNLVKNQREHDFIQDMARHHGALSYAQETWLMDVFDRLRRHHSMMSEGG
jgi:hypothetical protein